MYDDFMRSNPGRIPKELICGAGLAVVLLGDPATGVPLLEACHGAGELRRTTVCLTVGDVEGVAWLRKRQRTSRTVFSRDFPVRLVSLRTRVSRASVLSSSSRDASWRMGRQVS